MKKIFIVSVILLLAAGMGFAQVDPDLFEYKNGIEDFAENLASVLPVTSSIGLNWNDSFIGQEQITPHFGVGVTAGFTTLPYRKIKTLIEETMGGEHDDVPAALRRTGIPIPAAAVDARFSAFLPFDVGLKFGYFDFDSDNFNVEYLLVGGDVRYCVLRQNSFIPKISVGAGFNYLRTKVAVGDALGDDVTIDASGFPGFSTGDSLLITSPDLNLEMAAKVIDFKVQASWKASIFEPSAGLGVSYGMSRVSAAAESHLSVQNIGGSRDLTANELAALKAFGDFDVDGEGIGYTETVNAFAYRLFGGVGLNLSIVRLDLGLIYGLNSGSWGTTFGGRVQL